MALPRYHWWIVAQLDGRTQLIYGAPDFGPDGGEGAARMKGLTMLQGGDFRLYRYRTSNLAQASAFHRGKRLISGEGLRSSTQRMGHEKTVDRIMKRRQRIEARRNR